MRLRSAHPAAGHRRCDILRRLLDRAGESELGSDADFLASSLAPSQDPNPSYGILWWLFGGQRAIVPALRPGEIAAPGRAFGGIEFDRRIAGSAPDDAVGGTGFGGQRLYLVPSSKLVIARLGHSTGSASAAGGEFDEAFWSRVPADLLELEGTP